MHTFSQISNFLFGEGNTQEDASNHNLLTGEACWLVFPLLKDFLVGVFFSEEFCRGELHGREPSPLPFGSRFFSGSCFIPHVSPREHLPFCRAWSLFPSPTDVPKALDQRQRLAFQVVFHEKTNASHDSLLQISDHHLSESDVVSRFSFLNIIFNVQRQQWL